KNRHSIHIAAATIAAIKAARASRRASKSLLADSFPLFFALAGMLRSVSGSAKPMLEMRVRHQRRLSAPTLKRSARTRTRTGGHGGPVERNRLWSLAAQQLADVIPALVAGIHGFLHGFLGSRTTPMRCVKAATSAPAFGCDKLAHPRQFRRP